MKKGGTIKISAENYVIPLDKNPYLLGFDLNPGNYIKITIEDEGGGIPKKNHNNIFEPFFTTKKTGTGLGLSVSYSIIKRHNGTITFESEEGIGTTFFILLPADFNVQNSESIIESEEKTASLNIFIMDDEEIIQRILSRMLENLGHQVTITSDIDDLVQKIEDAKKLGIHPNLIILDLIIHGKEGGLEAISILDNICPKAKLVISSGSINHPVMNDYIKYGLNFALHKPFTLEELKHAIETAFLN
jgi:CheY-like chemotaxis protein